MRRSEARRRLSLMIAAYGVDGSLVVPTYAYDPGAEGADVAPGDALKWRRVSAVTRRAPTRHPVQGRTSDDRVGTGT
ncbi:hypothetical protein ACIQAD_01955 [Streptomyces sp. NPDC088551]|uniref:hypothetical protein n=1 Tax=Streptomyces sp. NPDC088551 TaxID=3365863 RepID=UPI0038021CEB